jgi:hypothetical protein
MNNQTILTDRISLTGPIIISSLYLKIIILIVFFIIGFIFYKLIRGEILFCTGVINIAGSKKNNKKRVLNPLNIKTIDDIK